MDKYLSEKLKIISFISMIMVVFLHSYNTLVKTVSGNIVLNKGYSIFIQDFFSQGITRIAVPLFFVISGYLFFLKTEGTLNEFLLKIKKRIRTLVLPYLFWSIWGILLFFLLQSFPLSKNFFTNDLIRDYTINKLINTIFINPIAYQLWFVRDLVVIVFLSPILYCAVKYLKSIAVLFFLFTWLFNFKFIIFSNEALFFFVLGTFISIENQNLISKDLSKKTYWFYTFIWFSIVLCKTILVFIEYDNTILLNILQKSGILIGIIAIWSQYDLLFKNKIWSNTNFLTITSFSFFLYAFHEPVLTIFKKGLFYLIGQGEMSSLLIYIIAPLLTIAISISIGYFIKRIAPKIYGLITGGR